MEEISGGRMHYMFNRVGGLKEELPAGWLGRVGAAAAAVRADLPRIGAVVSGSAAFRGRAAGAGVLSAGQVRQYGVSGPAARASGVDFDLRRDEPYLAYAELAGHAAGGDPGGGRLPGPVRVPAGSGRGVAGPGGRVRQPAGQPAPRAAQRADPQGAADSAGARCTRGPRGRSG